MCGICGAVGTGSNRVEPSHVQAMTAILHHRGPDASHVVSGGDVALGHARLSIIDLSGGAQPMATHDHRYWIVFNGEIFNYVELRRELEGYGHSFLTNSDTEVILESYRRWGVDCFRRLNGQWGIAIWDVESRRVTIARDRLGIRPLFYTDVGGTYVFASEIKALFCYPGVRRELDPVGLSQTMTFWCPVSPSTVFRDVHQLPPATYATIDIERGTFRQDHYWTLEFGVDSEVRRRSLNVNQEAFRDALITATRLRFDRSDVPVGAYLSGGIDSTVTVAVLANYTNAPLRTFSVAFSDREFDESRYQAMVAQRLGTEHETIRVDSDDIGHVFPEVIWHGEQPILRTAPAPLYLLSGLVRRNGLKVVVTGEGSDEVLAGYDIFREAAVRRIAAEGASPEKLHDLVTQLYPWMERSPARAPAFAKAFFAGEVDPDDPGLSHRPRWRASAALLRMLTPELKAPSGEAVASTLLSGLPNEFRSWKPLEQAQYLEIKTLLAGYILAAQGDRMLMGHSVEGRFPFLDHNVVELASSLPPEQKLCGLDEKHVLKVAFDDLIPDEIKERPKQPYRAPDASSFYGEHGSADWLESVIGQDAITKAGVFKPVAVAGLVRKCREENGQGMSNTDNMRIVSVVSTMLLHQQFVQGTDRFRRASQKGEEVLVTVLDEETIGADA